jgi:L-asparagine oxygenase
LLEPRTAPWRTLRIPPETTDAVAAWCAAVTGNPYDAGEVDGVRRAVWERLGSFPAELRRAAGEFGRAAGGAGVLHVTGLPLPDGPPPTPQVPYTAVRRRVGTEPLLLAVGDTVGDVFSFADWHDGAQVQNLYPVRSEARRQNASNSVFLEMHTETAFRPSTPDALALLCLRSDPQAQTLVCDLREVWAGLGRADASALADAAFAFPLPGGGTTEPKPVVVDWHGRRRFHYADALVAVGGEHARALDALREGVHATASRVVLEAGDLLLVDNVHTVHGRTAYRPRYDGSDRWLQRCLIRVTPERAVPR